MLEDARLDHTRLLLPANAPADELLPQVAGAAVVLGLLGVPVLGMLVGAWGAVLALALIPLGMLLSRLSDWLRAEHVELCFYPARIEVRYGRRALTLLPALDTIRLDADLLAQTATLVVAKGQGRGERVEVGVKLTLDEEKRVWRYIDHATRSARSRTGMGAREVPPSLQAPTHLDG